MKGRDVLDVLAHAEIAVEAGLISDERKLGPCVDRSRPMTVDEDVAAGRLEEPGCESQEGGLAGSIGADECDELSLLHRQIERLQRDEIVVPLREGSGLEGGGAVVVHGHPNSKRRERSQYATAPTAAMTPSAVRITGSTR